MSLFCKLAWWTNCTWRFQVKIIIYFLIQATSTVSSIHHASKIFVIINSSLNYPKWGCLFFWSIIIILSGLLFVWSSVIIILSGVAFCLINYNDFLMYKIYVVYRFQSFICLSKHKLNVTYEIHIWWKCSRQLLCFSYYLFINIYF